MSHDRQLAEANVRSAEAWIAHGRIALDIAHKALRAAVEQEIRALPPIAHASDFAGIVTVFTSALGEPESSEDDRAEWEFGLGGILTVAAVGGEIEVTAFIDGVYGGDSVERWTVCHTLDGVFKSALCGLAREGVFVEVRT